MLQLGKTIMRVALGGHGVPYLSTSLGNPAVRQNGGSGSGGLHPGTCGWCAKVLKGDGRDDLAREVDQLFTEIPAGNKISLGMEEFEDNLALARVTDAKNVIKDPHAQQLEVEDAMAVTLQKNGIEVPDSFFTVAGNFKPKFPPK
jgi:hypothetical protein